MSHKVVSYFPALAVTGFVALLASTQVVAESRPEVVERIKPVGVISIEGAPQPAAAASAPVATPAPADPGAALYAAKGCNACHGAEGKAPIMPAYPKVSSLPAKYIVNQLKDIKSGARANGQSAVMKGIMAAVTEADMEKLAEYLSAIPRSGSAAAKPAPVAAAPVAAPSPAAAPANPGAALYAAKGCNACHGAEGKAPIMPAYPKVSSLPAKYIVNQLKDIKSGARANGQSAVMKGIMAAVSEADMEKLAEYLSAIPRSGSAAAKPAPVAAAPVAAAAPMAAPASPGAALYTAKGCNACHGAEGKAPIMPAYPKVSSLPAKYIVNQLKDIKSGARANGQSAVMKGIMAAVSDDDMVKLADYLSAIPR